MIIFFSSFYFCYCCLLIVTPSFSFCLNSLHFFFLCVTKTCHFASFILTDPESSWWGLTIKEEYNHSLYAFCTSVYTRTPDFASTLWKSALCFAVWMAKGFKYAKAGCQDCFALPELRCPVQFACADGCMALSILKAGSILYHAPLVIWKNE